MKTEFGEKLKQKSYKEKETIEKRGPKRYRERLIEEAEAEKEIKEYKEKEAIDPDYYSIQEQFQ